MMIDPDVAADIDADEQATREATLRNPADNLRLSGQPRKAPETVAELLNCINEYIIQNHTSLAKAVHDVPKVIDDEIARLKLAAMGINIDTLTDEQERYLNSWELGTE